MKLSQFLLIKGIVNILFGLGGMLVPALIISIFGMTTNAVGIFFIQILGAFMLGLGLIYMLYRDKDKSILNDLLLVAFIYCIIFSIIVIIGQLSGIMNVLGWSLVALGLLFTAGFGYYRFLE